MRVTPKGQVTIPIAIRKTLGLLPKTEVEFRLLGSAAYLFKASPNRMRARRADVLSRLAGKADVKISTDEILALTRRGR